VQTAADHNCTATQLKTFVTSSGVVTSVGFSVPGSSIFTATGSPVTGAGTLGFTTAGTSGGIPYFSSAAALSSSAVLTANLPVIGGGAGVAPSVGSVSGTTTKFATVNVTTFATGQCVQVDASLNLTTTGSACGAGGGGTTIGTTTITGGTSGNFLYNNAGVYGERTPTQTTAVLIPFSTSTTAQGVVPGSNGAAATSFLNATGAWSVPAGGGGAPGGSTTQVQYNNAGAFGGISNVTTNGTSFTEADINASSSSSTFVVHGSAFTSTGININSSGNILLGGDGSGVTIDISSSLGVRGNSIVQTVPAIVFTDTAGVARATSSWWDAGTSNVSGIIEQRFTTVPQTYRVYNTTDVGATNYERGVLDWTTTGNTLTIGVQAAGTGSSRPVTLTTGTLALGFAPLRFEHTTLDFYNSTFALSGGLGAYFQLTNSWSLAWGPGDAHSTPDVGFSRVAVGVLAVGNGSPGDKSGRLQTAALQASGTVPTGNTGTCATGVTVAGGATAGTWTSTAICSIAGTIILTAMPTMTTGYACSANDRTTAAVVLQQTASSTTSATFTVRSTATAANDVISYSCIGY
jgi:hypothetical protein